MMMRLFPELFARQHVHPVEHYPGLLLETLRASAPPQARDPVVAVLTPGQHNSAYFEHAFLAQQMGVELVEGMDQFREGQLTCTCAPRAARSAWTMIYRRVDDAFLDPLRVPAGLAARVPGLLSVYRAGHVALANAIGTGVADDKSTYPFVPKMIRFYLGEEPILDNVPTWQCRQPEDLELVMDRLPELVVEGSRRLGRLRHADRGERRQGPAQKATTRRDHSETCYCYSPARGPAAARAQKHLPETWHTSSCSSCIAPRVRPPSTLQHVRPTIRRVTTNRTIRRRPM